MLNNGIPDIAASGGWHLMIIEALAVGAFIVAAFLIWDRTRIWQRARRIETQLRKMERRIGLFEMRESRRFVMELNARSGVRTDQRETAEEIGAGDVTEPAISLAAGAGERPSHFPVPARGAQSAAAEVAAPGADLSSPQLS
jgi:hypothetical protein